MKRANLFCFVMLTPFLIINCASTPYTTTFTEIDDLIEEGAWEIVDVRLSLCFSPQLRG